MDFQSAQYPVDKLIQWIRTGRLALPDFQRDFVWNPTKVVELLDSVAKQWPIGSLLLLSGPQPFGVRAIEGAPPLETNTQLDIYVLDGQQRLTALYHAISDVSEFVYFIDFNLLRAGGDDHIQWNRRKTFARTYPDLSARAEHGIALIKDVWDMDSFYSWLEGSRDSASRRDFIRLREKFLGGLHSQVYQLMAIQLDKKIQLEALARIFETLNRTGMRLNAFDLMVAMLYPSGFHLRDKWQEATESCDTIAKFDVDPTEILKLVSLLVRAIEGRIESKGVRQGDLLELKAELIRGNWDGAVTLYEKALQYSNEYLGIFCEDALPSWSLVLGVAGWLFSEQRAPESWAIPFSTLARRWFWESAFTQSYAQGANTKIVSDFDAISSVLVQRDNESEFVTRYLVFEQSARKNGLASRAFACLLAQGGALDPISGEPLKGCSSFAFRVVSRDANIFKLGNMDTFESLIIVSPASERQLNKTKGEVGPLGVEPETLRARLATQFLSGEKFQRTDHDYKNAFKSVLPEVVQ